MPSNSETAGFYIIDTFTFEGFSLFSWIIGGERNAALWEWEGPR